VALALAHEFGELPRLMIGYGEKSDVLTADGDLSDHKFRRTTTAASRNCGC
jgi:hypothetical protein